MRFLPEIIKLNARNEPTVDSPCLVLPELEPGYCIEVILQSLTISDRWGEKFIFFANKMHSEIGLLTLTISRIK